MHVIKPAKITGVCVMVVALLSACVVPTANETALRLAAPPVVEGQTTLSIRAMQSKSYDTLKTKKLVQAATATLQDLGFTVEEVSSEYGVLVGAKDRDAVETGQVAVQVALVLLAALAGSSHNAVYDETQVINVAVVVNSIDEKSSQVRAFFNRHITNNQGLLWKVEVITDGEIYQQFFEKLSASTFLEENQL